MTSPPPASFADTPTSPQLSDLPASSIFLSLSPPDLNQAREDWNFDGDQAKIALKSYEALEGGTSEAALSRWVEQFRLIQKGFEQMAHWYADSVALSGKDPWSENGWDPVARYGSFRESVTAVLPSDRDILPPLDEDWHLGSSHPERLARSLVLTMRRGYHGTAGKSTPEPGTAEDEGGPESNKPERALQVLEEMYSVGLILVITVLSDVRKGKYGDLELRIGESGESSGANRPEGAPGSFGEA